MSLMTLGESIVGNLGGFDSSIEITALGNPVNFVSRIDEATKNIAMRHLVTNRHIVMDERTANALIAILPDFRPEPLNLRDIGVRIRDFESVDRIFLFCVDPIKNQNISAQLKGLVMADVSDAYRSV